MHQSTYEKHQCISKGRNLIGKYSVYSEIKLTYVQRQIYIHKIFFIKQEEMKANESIQSTKLI